MSTPSTDNALPIQVGNFGDSFEEQLRQRLQSLPLPNYLPVSGAYSYTVKFKRAK